MRQSLLMCPPEYFAVKYVINPWMKNQVGKVDLPRATQQWFDFFHTVRKLADVKLIDPQPMMPDMVFTANAGLLIGNTFLPSRFRYDERRAEEPCFRSWFESNGYEIVNLPGDIRFEGAGDALVQPNSNLLWVAHGFRTDLAAHDALVDMFGINAVSLRLVNPHFYHLDTCFCPLPGNRVMYYPPAFDSESVQLIEKNSEHNIIVSQQDAEYFACNAVLIDKTIIINNATRDLRSRLEEIGYSVVTVSVSEFLKSGGANKCLTMVLDDPLNVLGIKRAA